jgi:hypothetical protein
MSRDDTASPATLAEVQAAASDLLRQALNQDTTETGAFPYGVSRVAVNVRAGAIEVAREMSGPDHAHSHDWETEGLEDDFLDEDEEEV